MHPNLKETLLNAVHQVIQAASLESSASIIDSVGLENLPMGRPSHAKFGDFTSSIALALAKKLKKNPRELAAQIIACLAEQHPACDDFIEKIEIAGPGHINFYMGQGFKAQTIHKVLEAGPEYGAQPPKSGHRILLEFVSANPTGPLHVGHGRGAAYGASLANLLTAAGHDVTCEYYVNDAGRQMNILALSVWLRFLQQHTQGVVLPSNAYQGDYIIPLAESAEFLEPVELSNGSLEPATITLLTTQLNDDTASDAKEQHLDQLIELCQNHLGSSLFRRLREHALNAILDDIRDDLGEFGVHYQHWFSEIGLHDSGQIAETLQRLEQGGYLYEKGGATWFRSTDFGDDKDRVVKRDNGQFTYFAADIAYHAEKFQRGHDEIINIWGADHHGYIARVKAAITALGLDAERLTINLVQFANLVENGEKIPMSTRSGQFVTLRFLRDKVGKDASRFFYVQRQADQHMDFDISLALSQNKDNPVYYIQYTYARVNSVAAQIAALPKLEDVDLSLLTQESELQLLNKIADYPNLIQQAAKNRQPHQITSYLQELAGGFHSYYNATRILVEDEALKHARAYLALAVQQVVKNGLTLLDVSTPERM